MQQEQKRQKKHVQWDEEKLKETEKFRGTFQKIDEPKTPYRKNEESDEEIEQARSEQEIALDESLYKARLNSTGKGHTKVDIAELNAKLKQQLQRFQSGEKGEMEDEQQEQKRKQREQFKKKRASHYNEFKLIQQMKHQRWEEEDD